MNILMISHIGETFGHLVRGLAIADELTAQGVHVEFAASYEADWLLSTWKHPYIHHKLRWQFSHNSCDPDRPPSTFLNHVLESNSAVLKLVKNLNPDLIVGLPGIFTTQAARHLGIPHVSILHGPYLSPIVSLKEATKTESAVIEFARKIFCGGCVDSIYSHLSQVLGVPKLRYEEYLRSETVFVPQPGILLPDLPNIHQVRFIRASFGPQFHFQEADLKKACYITFGSGNPCDISRIVQLAREVFPLVIISTGRTQLKNAPKGVVAKPFIASSSLAGRVAAVISHGGIGTVGTFAEQKTPQLIIPTELDQATMAVHAARLGIAKHCGLNAWVTRLHLGRHLPNFNEEEFINLLHTMRSAAPAGMGEILSLGASDIASALVRISTKEEQLALHRL